MKPIPTTSDSEWNALTDLTRPLPAQLAYTIRNAPDQRESRTQAEIGRLKEASQRARDFYLKYPADSRSQTARKIEAVTALHCVQLGGVQHQATALAIGSAFRNDKKNSVNDRIDVALAMETLNLPASLAGRPLVNSGTIHEALADRLNAEFAGVPQVYGLYLNIVRTAGQSTAMRVANKIKSNNGAPTWAVVEAQHALDRLGKIGKPLGGTLTAIDGHPVPLAAKSGQITVLFFWGAHSVDADLKALAMLRPAIPAGIKWIYVGLGAESPGQADLGGRAPFVGEYCIEPKGIGSPTMESLAVVQTPSVYVLNADGQLAGMGRVEELPTLVHAAAQ